MVSAEKRNPVFERLFSNFSAIKIHFATNPDGDNYFFVVIE
jgi:hypothetical protein